MRSFQTSPGASRHGPRARAALPHLRTSDRAAIVNTGSIAGWAGLPQRALYSATKGAVHALTLAMAADHVPDGIRVTAVAPGTADTPWAGRLLDKADDPAAERAALEARQPSGRLVTPDDIAGAICYLASPLSAPRPARSSPSTAARRDSASAPAPNAGERAAKRDPASTNRAGTSSPPTSCSPSSRCSSCSCSASATSSQA